METTVKNSVLKPKTGRLVLRGTSGKNYTLEANKPFAVLQQLKKDYIRRGYKSELLRITY